MKKYFLHILKKNLLTLACLTLLCVVVYVVPVATGDYSAWNSVATDYWRPAADTHVVNIIIALCGIAVFVPIFLFSYRMNRRSADMHYSLPVTKTAILAANYLLGLILVYLSYTFAYWLGFIFAAVRIHRLYLINYIYLYLASLIPAFIMYSVTAFIYTRANTVIDGILCVIGSFFVLFLAVEVISDKFYSYLPAALRGDFSTGFVPFGGLITASEYFSDCIVTGGGDKLFSNPAFVVSDIWQVFGMTLWVLIAVAATVWLFLSERWSKPENCGQRSDSPFCYKVQLPVYAALLSALCYESTAFIYCLVAFIILVFAIIYRRTVKIGWKFALVLAVCYIGGIVVTGGLSAILGAAFPA